MEETADKKIGKEKPFSIKQARAVAFTLYKFAKGRNHCTVWCQKNLTQEDANVLIPVMQDINEHWSKEKQEAARADLIRRGYEPVEFSPST